MENTQTRLCPVCGHPHEHLVKQFDPVQDQPLLRELTAEVQGWSPQDGVCTRCIDQVGILIEQQTLMQSRPGVSIGGFQILPLRDRLSTEPHLTGRGITICMIDSGFDLHPDLLYPENRVLKVLDMTKTDPAEISNQPQAQKWHGTMTSVVCAGNGHLSAGKYSSLAPDARLVLLRVMNDQGVITSASIVKALNWVSQHHHQYHIRIVNLSVYGDEGLSSASSPINQAVRQLVKAGIVVVAAAGNDPEATLHAPANAAEAISVGGLDDQNSISPLMNTLYHSSYGMVDRFISKPDVIAPAIWIPAPILPHTTDHREARILFDLLHASDQHLPAILSNAISHTSFPFSLLNKSTAEVRAWVNKEIELRKYITPHYKHVDGTSFAAPIVCSMIAQILEANPALDPTTIREIILVTSRFLPAASGDRQGWGVVQPKFATQMAEGKKLSAPVGVTPVIDHRNRQVQFYFYHPEAGSVGVSGDFLKWKDDIAELQRVEHQDAAWTITLPFEQKGVYQYKFIVDKQQWMADPRNPYRQPDGYNGFNSQLIIQ